MRILHTPWVNSYPQSGDFVKSLRETTNFALGKLARRGRTTMFAEPFGHPGVVASLTLFDVDTRLWSESPETARARYYEVS